MSFLLTVSYESKLNSKICNTLNDCEEFLSEFFEEIFINDSEFFESYDEFVKDYLRTHDDPPIELVLFNINKRKIMYDLHLSFLQKCYVRFLKKNC